MALLRKASFIMGEKSEPCPTQTITFIGKRINTKDAEPPPHATVSPRKESPHASIRTG